MPEPQDQSPEPEKSYKLPEKDYFSGDNMEKFATEMGLFKDEQPAPEKAAAKPVEKKPCPNCPPEEVAAKTAEAKPETRTPIKVLKVNGQDVPIYSEKDLVDLAQKGAHYTQERQKDAKWEKSLQEREAKINALIEEIKGARQQGQSATAADQQKLQEEKARQDAELEAIEDPAAREAIKKRDAEVEALKRQNEESRRALQKTALDGLLKEMDGTLDTMREKYPFEEVKSEDGRNITQEFFGAVYTHRLKEEMARAEREPGYQPKSLAGIMEDTLRDIHAQEKHFRGTAKEAAVLSADSVTADVILEKYPQIAEELGQRAVAAHLKTMGEAPPTAKGRSDGLMRRSGESGKKAGGFASLDEAFAAAGNNPEIASAIEEASKKARFSA